MSNKPKDDWHSQPKMSRWAAVLFPHLTSRETQAEMQAFADKEKKKSPLQAYSDFKAQGSGTAKKGR